MKRGKEENKLSWANLGDGRSQTKTKRGVTEYAGVTQRRRTSTRARYTNDVMRKNNIEKSKARRACTDVSIRLRRAGKGLVNHARRTVLSQAGARTEGTGWVTGRTVKLIEELDGYCRRYKHCMWVV